VADYGTPSAKVILGSENFSDNSLNHNRELGLIVDDSAVISGVESAFNGTATHLAVATALVPIRYQGKAGWIPQPLGRLGAGGMPSVRPA
jgi:phosphatidylserine/phosphatidylglycerophosphate/cardiolipin synthase-like enzyme